MKQPRDSEYNIYSTVPIKEEIILLAMREWV